jgi:hypothetical protein
MIHFLTQKMNTETEINKRINRYKLVNSILITIAVGITALMTLLAEPLTWGILMVLLWTITISIILFIVTKIRHLRDELVTLRQIFPQPVPIAQPVQMMYYTAQTTLDPYTQVDFSNHYDKQNSV